MSKKNNIIQYNKNKLFEKRAYFIYLVNWFRFYSRLGCVQYSSEIFVSLLTKLTVQIFVAITLIMNYDLHLRSANNVMSTR